jgi:hypothetical protein
MSPLARKAQTALKILQADGISRFTEVLLGILGLAGRVNFRRVAATALNKVDDSADVIRSLVRGVSYVFGMGVAGDVAEFGMMTGKSAVALAVATNRLNTVFRLDPRGTKKVWFFDSFEGLPDARFDIDKNSQHVVAGTWAKGKCKGLDETSFQKHIAKYLSSDDFYVVKGWFKDTVSTIPDNRKLALLHIDGDLYESAIDALDPLFRRQIISNGAIIFFDDWNCNAADPALGEKRAWQEVCEKYKIHFSDEGAYGDACHKFIVHSYSSELKASS